MKEATEKADKEPEKCYTSEEKRVRWRSNREEEEERCTDRVYQQLSNIREHQKSESV